MQIEQWFLGHKRKSAKTKLALHHLYCLGCKAPREPDGKFAEYAAVTPSTGMLMAICPECENVINKIVRRVDLDAIQAKVDVSIQQANPRLVSLTKPRLNATVTKEAQTNENTQSK